MTKQQKENTKPYTKAERRAEAEIDSFLYSVNPSVGTDILEQLRQLA